MNSLRKAKSLSLFLLTAAYLLVLNCHYSFAADWFVRPSGTAYGNSDGRLYTNAWSGFSKVIWGDNGVMPGDTLYICGKHTDKLTIQSSGDNSGYITIRGDCFNDYGIIDSTMASGIFFSKKYYLHFIALTFMTSVMGIESYDGCNNIIIENCIFSNHVLKGIHLYSKNISSYVESIRVTSCTFIDIGTWGNTGANDLTYAGYSRNTITENCTFRGNGTNRGVDGILIENIVGDGSNHVIKKCNFSGHEENSIDLKHVVQSPLGEGPTQIHENDFSASNELEIVLHWGTKNVHIYRNTFHDGVLAIGLVKHNTIGIDNSNGNIAILYNVFKNFSHGILMDSYPDGIGNSMFINNTCHNAGYRNFSNYSLQIATNNWIIKNNIFSHLSIGKQPHATIRFLPSVNMSTISIDHNCHYSNKGNYAYRFPDDAYVTIDKAEKNGIFRDPQFASTTNAVFSLKADSGCIDKGTTVSGVHPTMDVTGKNVLENAVDMGANEFHQYSPISPPQNVRVPK